LFSDVTRSNGTIPIDECGSVLLISGADDRVWIVITRQIVEQRRN
jgi:hypothetical protein